MNFHNSVLIFCVIGTFFQTAFAKNFTEEELDKFEEECIKETNASPDDVKLLTEEDIWKLSESTNNQFCFLACFYRKIGDLKPNENKYEVQKYLDTIEPLKETDPEQYEMTSKLIIECDKEVPVEEDVCKVTENFIKCVRRKLDEIIAANKKEDK